MEEIITNIKDWVSNALEAVVDVLPTSPFTRFLELLDSIPFLAHLNYFVPISTFIAIGTAWLSAISAFYIYSVILRWVKAVS